MSEPQPTGPTDAAEAAARLHEIARRLRVTQHLGTEEQQALADLADELGIALERPTTASAATPALAESVTHLAEALQHRQTGGLLQGVRQRLEDMAAAMEARTPHVAAFARELVEVLANLGI
jgi:hypothetical protein